MSGVIRSEAAASSRRTSKGPGAGSWLLFLSAAVPGVVALSALVGVGLARNLPAQGALLGGLLFLVLPILGLASPLRRGPGPAALGLACWLWSAMVLFAVPMYFPGELGEAVAEGTAWMSGPLGEDLAASLGEASSALALAVVPAASAPPEAPELAVEPEEERTPRSVPVATATQVDEPPPAVDVPTGRVVLPYEGGGRSMRVPVTFLGPGSQLTHTMLFDTGATLTTLSTAALAELGLPLPPDAPVVTLQTANGQVDAPLVLLDGVSLGAELVDWATIAVCDACAEGGVAGLLGLNVTGLFQIALDHEEQEIDMTRRGRRMDRYSDVVHWVEIDSSAKVWTDGRIEVEVTAENLARAPLEALSIEVACAGGSFAVDLDAVPGNAARTTTVSLPRGTDCREYRVMLREGRWGV